MIRAVYVPELCVTPFSERQIICAFHDIDGTHSLIRDWPPVMSAVLHDVIARGLPPDFDSAENTRRLILQCGKAQLPETDRFCVESAGLSALTQMEWAIRRAIQEGTVSVAHDETLNAAVIQGIWAGREIFADITETKALRTLLREQTPRLFRLYEAVLNGYCRDVHLQKARQQPESFRVPGSLSFLRQLHESGVANYFVTGAVIEPGKGMLEEVLTLGYEVGPGRVIEDVVGSSWEKKLPKNIIMQNLCACLGLRGEQILVTGDGRSEISAGVKMRALTLSRLDADAGYQRALHRQLGTNMIVSNYHHPVISQVFGIRV